MPIRPTMPDLITRVRDLIGDPATGPTITWSDPQIQDALDRERTDYLLSDYRELAGRYSASAGVITWTDYYEASGWGDWEADATLYNGSMTLLTPTTSDYLTGHWTFAVSQTPPVFIVGKTYDVHAAARAIVIRWMGLEARSFDFSVDRGLQFSVSQKRAGLQMLADALATEMRVRSAKWVRRDVV